MTGCALTIAGSDPTGGSGIQADLKTFASLRVYGLSVMTSLTAQNSKGVRCVLPVPSGFIRDQIESLIEDFQISATKIGMVYRQGMAEEIAGLIKVYALKNIVLDPVMRASSGGMLLRAGGLDVLKRGILPLTTIITPNLEEAGILIGRDIVDLSGMKDAACMIHSMGPGYVLIKGGHLEKDIFDLLFDGKDFVITSFRRYAYDVRGTGCTLSAAIAAGLARGRPVEDATSEAQAYTQDVIHRAIDFGKGAFYPGHFPFCSHGNQG